MTPQELGLPDKFSQWREDQEQCLDDILLTGKRFNLLAAPTGFGKSAVYLALSQYPPRSMTILTETKGLQDQLMSDFRSMGLVDIRGKNSYVCGKDKSTRCDLGRCVIGVPCDLKDQGCRYYDALRTAQGSTLVVTNYYMWLYNQRYSPIKLPVPEVLVCDEAHGLPDLMSAHLTLKFPDPWGILDAEFPKSGWEQWKFRQWQAWALTVLDDVQLRMERETSPKWVTRFQHVHRSLKELAKANEMLGQWVHAPAPKSTKPYLVYLFPLFPAFYTEDRLFHGAESVLLVSASIRPKTADLLGAWDENRALLEYSHRIPVENRALYHIPTARINYKTEQDGDTVRYWMSRIDSIVGARLDRKGIIHTGSYKRRNTIMSRTRHSQIMLTHSDQDTQYVLKQFRKAEPPCILVSPSMSTGMDFPYTDCEYQIITKIPYPTADDPVLKARNKVDQDYSSYVAMQNLVQTCGRGVRAPDDRCENLIIDDNIRWFLPRYADFAPGWFKESIRFLRVIPRPPQRIERR